MSELSTLSFSEQSSSLHGIRFPVTRRHVVFAAFVTILLAADHREYPVLDMIQGIHLRCGSFGSDNLFSDFSKETKYPFSD